MIKTFFAVLAASAVLIPTAKAAPNIQEGAILGYQVTIIDSGSFDKPDFIGIYGPHGLERLIVTCAPFDWTSAGPNSTEFVDSIAREWCF